MEKYLQIKQDLIETLDYHLNYIDNEYDRLKEDCVCSLSDSECKCDEIFNNETNFKIILGTNISCEVESNYLNFKTGEWDKRFNLIRDYSVEVNGKTVMENLKLNQLSFSLWELDDEETEVLLDFLSTITLEKGEVPKEKLEEIADNCIQHLINSF